LTPRIFLITGLMASGKSTVAQALAARLPYSVHLRGDVFRKMIVNGQAPMGPVLSEEAQKQLSLRYDLASDAARRFFEAGFNVVYQDIVLGPTLREVAARFEGLPFTLVVLCPDAETIGVRERQRSKSGYRNAGEIAFFDRVLREETPRIGLWVDSTGLSVAETVSRVLADITSE
jgi:predicted kinase